MSFWTRVRLPSTPFLVMFSCNENIAYADAIGQSPIVNASAPLVMRRDPRSGICPKGYHAVVDTLGLESLTQDF